MAINLRREWRIPRLPDVLFEVNWDSPQAAGLVAWWPFIGSQGVFPLRDMLGMSPMTPVNGPTWTSDSEKGWCVAFNDAANQYLAVDRALVTAAPLTMSCWFRSDNITLEQIAISIKTVDADHYFWLDVWGAGVGDPVAFGARAGGGANFAKTTTGYSANTWHHACGVEIASNSRAVYIDGGSKGTNAGAATPAGLNCTWIGGLQDYSLYMSGRIFDVRIYNRALADVEVWQLYDPATRWDLYRPLRRWWVAKALAAAPTATTGYMTPMRGYWGT